MIAADQTPPRMHSGRLKAVVSALTLGLLLTLLPAALARLLGRLAPTDPRQPDARVGYRRELRSYLWGIGLALALTGVPFALVYWSAAGRFWLYVAIATCALVQMVIHFRFFLHVSFSEQKREDLQLILFSTLILTVMAGGTIWVLDNLALRMH